MASETKPRAAAARGLSSPPEPHAWLHAAALDGKPEALTEALACYAGGRIGRLSRIVGL